MAVGVCYTAVDAAVKTPFSLVVVCPAVRTYR